MYTYHKDIPNNQWNVFEVVNKEHEVYVCSFSTAEQAISYCALMNRDLQPQAEIQTKMGE